MDVDHNLILYTVVQRSHYQGRVRSISFFLAEYKLIRVLPVGRSSLVDAK